MSEVLFWRCEITGNPVRTDTRMIGSPPCDCQGCRAAVEITSLREENERLKREHGTAEAALQLTGLGINMQQVYIQVGKDMAKEEHRRSFLAGWMRYDTSADCDISRANAEFDAWWPEDAAPAPTSNEAEDLRSALHDLLTWFPDKPSPPEWRLKGGEQGADEAVQHARSLIGLTIDT